MQGIFDGSCGTYPNHAVTAVGYGSSSSPEAVDYIIVKNSWGPKWGEVGYVRIKRNTGLRGGLCAINRLASFPIKFKTSITNSINRTNNNILCFNSNELNLLRFQVLLYY